VPGRPLGENKVGRQPLDFHIDADYIVKTVVLDLGGHAFFPVMA
jgi:hypothetical protein